MNQTTNKLLIIGWDGATFDIIRPMIARGELPHLTRLMDEGTHGPLRSTVPPSSAVAWSTFMTGLDPKGHGIFGFYQTDGHSYRPHLVSSRDLHAPCLWDWLGQAGYRVGVINVPLTYPPRPVHGFLVSGMLTPGPEETFTHPLDLAAQLLAAPRPYPIETQVIKRIRASKSPVAALDLLHRWTDDFHAAVRDLLSNQPWDCFVAVYRTTDIVQHFLGFLWRPELAARQAELAAQVTGGIEAVYRQLDTCLGELLVRVPPETTVLILSDHGAGPTFGRFYVNNWLHQQGYLSLKRGTRYRRWLGRGRQVPLRRVLTRLGLSTLARCLPTRLASWSVTLPDKHQFYHLIDWRHTRAYMPLSVAQGVIIQINLAGRELEGIVLPDAEAETVLTELAHHLTTLRDSYGKLLFQEVTIAPGGSTSLTASQGPDLVALPSEENYHAVFPNITNDKRIFADASMHAVGHHRMHGILVAHGSAITSGVTLQNAQLADVTPTALHLMGLPVPVGMDGQVLVKALRPDWLAVHPVQTTVENLREAPSDLDNVYSPEEMARVEGALRELGYLE